MVNYNYIRRSDHFLFGGIRFLEHFMGRKEFKYKERLLNYLYKKHENRMLKRMEGKSEGVFKPIEVVEDISPEEFHKLHLYGSKPLVLKGLAKNWECVQKWTPEYFSEKCGDDEVFLIDDHIATDESVLNDGNSISLREIINNLDNDKGKYARFVPLLDNHPELYDDFDVSWLSKRMSKDGKVALWGEKGKGVKLRSHLFIGRKNAKTDVHCALTNNFFVNVYGTKRWFVFSPDYNPFIYSPVNWGPGVFGTEVCPIKKDYDTYPLWKYVSGYEFVLEPGDVLYNPPFWWHRVSNESINIAVGLRWYDFKSAMKSSKVQNLLSLLSTNPTMRFAIKNATEYGKTHSAKKKKENKYASN